jgi:hypothetical protein
MNKLKTIKIEESVFITLEEIRIFLMKNKRISLTKKSLLSFLIKKMKIEILKMNEK